MPDPSPAAPKATLPFTIRQITSRADQRRFVLFPWQIYKGDPYWVPPFISERMQFLDPAKNPSFEHLEVALFVAETPGRNSRPEIVGTIAALINHRHNEFQHEKVGFYGLFEVVDNQPMATALLQTAERWVKEHLPEATAIRGPMNFSTNDECGLLVDGFDSRPLLFMTYNPPYYQRLVEDAGYCTAMDLWAWVHHSDEFFSPENPYLPKLDRIVNKVRERYGLTVRNANMKDIANEKLRLTQIYNAAWERNWGFVPVTEAEMEHLADGVLKFLDPQLVFFVEKDGQPVAFGLTLPDINIPVQKANGRLFPIGWLRFLLAKRKMDWVRVFALGVVPEYRGRGVDALLYYETAKAVVRRGYKHAECSWILANNDKMNQAIQSMGARVYKTYRVYEKALRNGGPA